MKNKVSLVLMEQLVMVLAFALGAALCLGVFVKAHNIAEATARREEGALVAQNGAELLKSGGDLAELDVPEGYYVTFAPQDTDLPGLSLGTVEVWHEGEKEMVFSLPVAWQEVGP